MKTSKLASTMNINKTSSRLLNIGKTAITKVTISVDDILYGNKLIEENIFTPKNVKAVNRERIESSSNDQLTIKISERGWDKSTLVFIANDSQKTEAFLASALAGTFDAPIFYANDKITDATMNEINRLEAERVVLIGGSRSLSEELLLDFEK